MVQANALLVAAALTVTVTPALAVDVPTCEQVREHAKNYTLAEIRKIAKRVGLSAEQWAQVRRCIEGKK